MIQKFDISDLCILVRNDPDDSMGIIRSGGYSLHEDKQTVLRYDRNGFVFGGSS
jgi:hypothetical protein